MNAQFHRLDRAPEATAETRAVIGEALLPVRWWRGITVTMRKPSALTPMERFILEVALAFDSAAPAEFEEVTGLPASMYPILGRRLVATGAITATGVPTDGVALRAMLDTEEVYTERTLVVDAVALPATGDLVILHAGKSGGEPLLGWEKARVQPVNQYPVDTHLASRTVGDVVAEAAAGSLGVVRVESDEMAYPDGLCSVYRCRAQVVEGPGASVRLSIGERAPTVNLAGVEGLIEGWVRTARSIAERPLAVWRAVLDADEVTGNPPIAAQATPVHWRLPITGAHAEQLVTAGLNLAVTVGIAVEAAGVLVEAALEPVAADSAAAAAIAMDRAINSAVTAGSTTAALCAYKATPGFPGEAALRKRAWQLGQHRLVYAMREKEDFGYV